MNTLMNLVRCETSRSLHRRGIWLLAAGGVLLSVVFGTIGLVKSGNFHPERDSLNAARLTDLWPGSRGVFRRDQGLLAIAATFLIFGGLIGGATAVGAEWKTGTMTTVLTWEPRRTRLIGTRLVVNAVLAFLIAFAVEILFASAALPAVFANGTTAGADGTWFQGFVAAEIRIALLAMLAAFMGATIATIGRSTAAGIVVMFGYLAVLENLIRVWRPGWKWFLIGDNIGILMRNRAPNGTAVTHGGVVAFSVISCWVALMALVAIVSFSRRDVAGV